MTTANTFTVNWSGQDLPNGSGLASFNVWVAVNGDNWGLWQNNTIATSALFTGTPGTRYDFLATAADNAGNMMLVPRQSQATILIQAMHWLYLPLVRKP